MSGQSEDPKPAIEREQRVPCFVGGCMLLGFAAGCLVGPFYLGFLGAMLFAAGTTALGTVVGFAIAILYTNATAGEP